jgi:hypothetical protein
MMSRYVQFDKMENFLHSRAKPLTIAIVVRGKKGQVLHGGRNAAKGRLARKGRAMGWTINDGPTTRAGALQEAA